LTGREKEIIPRKIFIKKKTLIRLIGYAVLTHIAFAPKYKISNREKEDLKKSYYCAFVCHRKKKKTQMNIP
jgi:hypothetical protein